MCLLKITVLIENTSPPQLVHEHGLSLHVAYDGHSYLLDAGHSGAFTKNAADLGIDLTEVACAALSHGHYDHADGLSAFFRVNVAARVLARPAVQEAYAMPLTAGGQNFIGVNPDLFECYADRFDFGEGLRALAPGLWLVPDSIPHEQSLVAETDAGLVVMNACCHAGPGHIVTDILAQFPGKKVHALVGGFHLMGKTGTHSLGVAPGIVKNLARWLTDELGVEKLYTGHCTGIPAFDLLRGELGDKLHPLSTGDSFTL